MQRQQRRARLLTLTLGALMIGQFIMLLGGAGTWAMLALAPPEGSTPGTVETARSLLPVVRLATVYTLLLLVLTWLTRRAVHEQHRSAFGLTLALSVLLLLAIPFGTLIAPLLLLLLPPRRWADLRPQRQPAPAAP